MSANTCSRIIRHWNVESRKENVVALRKLHQQALSCLNDAFCRWLNQHCEELRWVLAIGLIQLLLVTRVRKAGVPEVITGPGRFSIIIGGDWVEYGRDGWRTPLTGQRIDWRELWGTRPLQTASPI